MPLHAFFLKFGLNGSEHQSSLMQKIKSDGFDCIQTSDGICVKAPRQALDDLINQLDLGSVVTAEQVGNLSEQTKDVQAFVGGA